MAAKSGKKFCVEHGGTEKVEESDEEGERVPCPYDPKHSCYLKKLNKHLGKCNARPKDVPVYINPGVNSTDSGNFEENSLNYSIGSVSDEKLLELIGKINAVYGKENLENCERKFLAHETMEKPLSDPELGTNTKKHLIQNASLIKNMEENGFLRENVTFIEFGAGRGQLGFFITKAVQNSENCSLVLIDRASHRHKFDNMLKGASPVKTLRLRADISDVELAEIFLLKDSKNEIVGVTKHLCGRATDLALRCVVRGKSKGVNVVGVAMALCCHHRCDWTSFVGKKYLLEAGFADREFPALCSISSWATCGSGKPRRREKEGGGGGGEDGEEKGEPDNCRYKRLALTREIREEIGRRCKMILNHARLKYLNEKGFQGSLVYYVEETVSPENVCLIARLAG